MSNDKIKDFGDEIELPDDFDFDFNVTEPTDNRKPVRKVLDGALNEVNSKNTVASSARIIAQNALPSSLKSSLGKVSSGVNTVTDLYDKSYKELEAPVNSLKKTAHKKIESISGMPESVKKRLLKLTAYKESDYDTAPSKQDMENAAIAETINNTFKYQFKQQAEKNYQEQIEKLNLSKIERLKFLSKQKALDEIAANATRHTQYFEQIDFNYKKKMLELSQRKFFLLRDIANSNKAGFTDSISNLKAIAHNTAMPEYVKLQNNEVFKAQLKQRLYGNTQDKMADFLRNYGSDITDKLQQTVMDKVAGVRDGITSALDMYTSMESMTDMGDMGPDKMEMGGGMLAGLGVEKLMRKLGTKLGVKLEGNQSAQDMYAQIRYAIDNSPQLINEFVDNNSDTTLGAIAQMFLPRRTGNAESVNHNLLQNATEVAHWGELERRTLIEVIPGFLSRQLQQLTNIATGKKNDRLVYSVEQEAFTTLGEEKDRFLKRALGTDRTSRVVDEAVEMVNMLDPEGKLSVEDKQQLLRFFITEANEKDNRAFSVERLANGGVMDFEGSDRVAAFLRSQYGIDDNDDGSKLIPSRSNIQLNERLARIQSELGRGYGDVEEIVNNLNAMGRKEIAREAGVLGKRGDIDVYDYEKLKELFFERAITSGHLEKLATGTLKGSDDDDLSGMSVKERMLHQMKKTEQERALKRKQREEEKFGNDTGVRSFSAEYSDGVDVSLPGGGSSTLNMSEFIDKLSNVINGTKETLAERYTQFTDLFKQNAFINKDPGNGLPVHVLSMPGYMGDNDSGKPKPGEPDSPLYNAIKEHARANDEHLRNIAGMMIANEEGISEKHKLTMLRNSFSERMSGIKDLSFKTLKGIFNAPAGALSAGFGFGSNLGGSLKALFQNRNTGSGKSSVSDVINSRTKQVLLQAKVLKEGGYFNKETMEPITCLEDIDNEIVDMDQNVVVSLSDLQDGLEYKSGFKLPTAKLKSVIDSIINVNTLPFKMASNILSPTKLLARFNKVKEFVNGRIADLTIPGESEPRIRAVIMKAGGYSDKDGNVITRLKDIKGEIFDKEGNRIVDFNELVQLRDRWGNKLDLTSAKDKLRSAIEGGKSLAKKLFLKTVGFPKKLSKGLKSIIGSLRNKFNKNGLGKLTGGLRGNIEGGATDILARIYEFMTARWGMPDPYLEQIAANTGVIYASHDKDVNADVNVFKEKAVNNASEKDYLATIAKRLTPPKRKAFDKDGDGDRDGSWQDQLQKARNGALGLSKKGKGKLAGLLGGLGKDKEGGLLSMLAKAGGSVGSLLSLLGVGGGSVTAALASKLGFDKLKNKFRKDSPEDPKKKRRKARRAKSPKRGFKMRGGGAFGTAIAVLASLGPYAYEKMFGREPTEEEYEEAENYSLDANTNTISKRSQATEAQSYGLGNAAMDMGMMYGGQKLAGMGASGVSNMLAKKSGTNMALRSTAGLASKQVAKGVAAKVGVNLAARAGVAALALSNPITASILAAVTVGQAAWYLYKFVDKKINEREPTMFEKVRFLQYGINIKSGFELRAIRKLESYYCDDVKFTNGAARWNGDKDDLIEEAVDLFGVYEDDATMIDQMGVWLTRRFIPIIMRHLSVGHALGLGDEMSDIDDGLLADPMSDISIPYLRNAIRFGDYGPEIGDPHKYNLWPWPNAWVVDTTEMVKEKLRVMLPLYDIPKLEIGYDEKNEALKKNGVNTKVLDKNGNMVSGPKLKVNSTKVSKVPISESIKPKLKSIAKSSSTFEAIGIDSDSDNANVVISNKRQKMNQNSEAIYRLQSIERAGVIAIEQRDLMIEQTEQTNEILREILSVNTAATDVKKEEVEKVKVNLDSSLTKSFANLGGRRNIRLPASSVRR